MKEHTLTIGQPIWFWMEAYVSENLPLEACGLLAGNRGVVEVVLPVKNVAKSPVRFRMDPVEQLRAFAQIEAASQEIIAIFHSHPLGPSIPSPTDISENSYEVVNLIWSPNGGKWQARGFWIESGHAAEVPLVVTER